MSFESAGPAQEDSAGEPDDVAAALPELLRRALRARIYDRQGRVEPATKRRDRVASSLLLDVKGYDAVAPWTDALRLRPGTEIAFWMQWPDLWIEFVDDRGMPLVSLGLLRPDWVRWEPHGDLQLAAPEVAEGLIASWGLMT